MNSKSTKFSTKNYLKIIGVIFFFVALLSSYIKIFAIASPYVPGVNTNPACIPGEINCTVSSILVVGNVDLGTSGVIYKGANTFAHNFNYGWNGVVTTEGFNTFFGVNAGNLTMGSTATLTYESSYDVGVGYKALFSNTKGYYNTATGANALMSNTTGNYNTAFGADALKLNTVASNNTAIGANALATIVSGQWNTAVGAYALYNNKYNSNTAMGYNSLFSNIVGGENLAIGANSSFSNTTGSQNIAIGDSSFFTNVTGASNHAVGWRAFYNLKQTSKAISAFSDYSGTVPGTVRATSVAHGRSTNDSLTITGTTNFNGTYTITKIDDDSFYFTHAPNVTETGWWGIGTEANYNVGMGYQVGYSLVTGSSNVFIGPNAGNNASQFLSADNSIAIGSGTYTTASNQAVYGNSSMTQHLFQAGNVGIGDLSPASLLTVGANDVFQVNSSGIIAAAAGITSSGTITFSGLSGCGGIQTNGGGVLSCTSDESLKDIKNNFTRGLDAIEQINPISFSWKEGTYLYDNGITYNGFSAQNVQSVLPEAISTSSDGYLQVSQLTLLATAINAIKELDLRVKNISTSSINDTFSVGSLVKQFLADSTNGVEEIFTKVLHSEKICIKNTCINEEQLIQILNNAGINPPTISEKIPEVLPESSPEATTAEIIPETTPETILEIINESTPEIIS